MHAFALRCPSLHRFRRSLGYFCLRTGSIASTLPRMSYDLYFTPGSVPVPADAFLDYFRERPHYMVSGSQAWYENEDTGVYFSFEHHEEDADGSDVDEPRAPCSFHINFFRPSYFILEAEPEVAALAERFALRVMDPQADGMGDGPYVRSALVSGWEHGNRFAVSAVMSHENDRPAVASLPTKRLHEVWRWNHGRASLQDSIGEGQFVPKIMFVLQNGAAATAVTWPDGIASVLPKVDYLIVGRDELAPRSFLRRKKDTVFARWEDAARLLGRYDSQRREGAFDLNYAECPQDVARFVRGLADSAPAATILPPDQVLDRELIVDEDNSTPRP